MRQWWIGIGVLAVGVVALAAFPAALPGRVSPEVGTPFRINAGGGRVTDSAGNQWQADRAYASSAGYGYLETNGVGNRVSHPVDVARTPDGAIFASERWGMEGYRVDVPNGTYDVELLFAETYQGITGAGQRVFDVAVEGRTVLTRLDVYAEAGFARALTQEVSNVMVTDGRLDIVFTPRVEQPMVKGIAVRAVRGQAASTATPTPTTAPASTPTPTVAATPGTTPGPQTSNVSPAPAAVADVPLRVNAGGAAFEDRQGQPWLADQAYSDATGWGYVGAI